MRIVTLNIWGAPYARDHTVRLTAICQKLKQIDPDVICLQEVYLENQRRQIIQNLAGIWQHHCYFYNGLLGSGLMILSRYPILKNRFYPFRLRGKPEKPHHGDYYAAKGIASTRIKSPTGEMIVFNTHTHAQYSPHDDNEYAVYTNSNLYEAVCFIQSHDPATPFIICGDLNTRPDQLGYDIIMQGTGTVDSFHQLHGEHPVTFASTNPYTTSDDQCLDYILTKDIQTITINIDFQDHPVTVPAYSDHYGLVMDFELMEHTILVSSTLPYPALNHLHRQIDVALCELDNQRFQYFGTALSAILALPDILFLSRLIRRFSPVFVRKFRNPTIILAWLTAVLVTLYTWINLTTRRNVLLALRTQIESDLRYREP
jgi:sphingomyelin phosphodiesterase 2